MTPSIRSVLFTLLLAVGACIAADSASGAFTVCFDSGGGRDWSLFKKGTCDDFAGGQGLNAKCYDLQGVFNPDPDPTAEGILYGSLPGLNGSAILGEYGGLTIIGRDDDKPLLALRTNGLGQLEAAPLALHVESLVGGDVNIAYSTAGPGESIPLPPLLGLEGQFLSDPPVTGDFAVYSHVVNLATNAVLSSTVVEYDVSQLNFRVIPEPSAICLAISGVAAVACLGRARRPAR